MQHQIHPHVPGMLTFLPDALGMGTSMHPRSTGLPWSTQSALLALFLWLNDPGSLGDLF